MVFPVAALDLLVDVFLDIALQNPGARRFVKTGCFENVGGIDPVVLSTAHNMFFQVRAKLVLIDGDLETPWCLVSFAIYADTRVETDEQQC